ncbi:hypothetical protein LXL04_033846 [Taraxacum kok-saghyz]
MVFGFSKLGVRMIKSTTTSNQSAFPKSKSGFLHSMKMKHQMRSMGESLIPVHRFAETEYGNIDRLERDWRGISDGNKPSLENTLKVVADFLFPTNKPKRRLLTSNIQKSSAFSLLGSPHILAKLAHRRQPLLSLHSPFDHPSVHHLLRKSGARFRARSNSNDFTNCYFLPSFLLLRVHTQGDGAGLRTPDTVMLTGNKCHFTQFFILLNR